jgi:hypothetical protein
MSKSQDGRIGIRWIVIRPSTVIGRQGGAVRIFDCKADALVGFVLWSFARFACPISMVFQLDRGPTSRRQHPLVRRPWHQRRVPPAHHAPRLFVPALARAHPRAPWNVLFAVLAGIVGSHSHGRCPEVSLLSRLPPHLEFPPPHLRSDYQELTRTAEGNYCVAPEWTAQDCCGSIWRPNRGFESGSITRSR